MIVCLSTYISFFSVCLLIFIFCWFKIGRRLKAIRAMGTNINYSFHYRLFLLLTIQVSMTLQEDHYLLQTCLPIVFNFFPAGSCFILSLAKIQAGPFPFICSMMVTFAQIFDPMFTVYFVAEYKSFFISCLPKVWPTRILITLLHNILSFC